MDHETSSTSTPDATEATASSARADHAGDGEGVASGPKRFWVKRKPDAGTSANTCSGTTCPSRAHDFPSTGPRFRPMHRGARRPDGADPLSKQQRSSYVWEKPRRFDLTMYSGKLPPIDPAHAAIIQKFGAEIKALDPIGAQVSGVDLSSKDAPPPELVEVLEREMAQRGFLVFKNDAQLDAEDFLRASCLWGGQELHSTHGVHPQTPGGSATIFRLSNDERHGRSPMSGRNGTVTAVSCRRRFPLGPHHPAGRERRRHAFRASGPCLRGAAGGPTGAVEPPVLGEFRLRRRAPAGARHPVSGQSCIWLHLGMTGAVIEKLPDRDGFSLLHADDLQQLCRRVQRHPERRADGGLALHPPPWELWWDQTPADRSQPGNHSYASISRGPGRLNIADPSTTATRPFRTAAAIETTAPIRELLRLVPRLVEREPAGADHQVLRSARRERLFRHGDRFAGPAAPALRSLGGAVAFIRDRLVERVAAAGPLDHFDRPVPRGRTTDRSTRGNPRRAPRSRVDMFFGPGTDAPAAKLTASGGGLLRLISRPTRRRRARAFGNIGAGTAPGLWQERFRCAAGPRFSRARRGKVAVGSRLDLGAGRRGTVLQAQKAADVFGGEPEFPGAQDEAQAPGMAGRIDTVAGAGPGRIGQQAGLLVVADRLDVAAGDF